MHEADMQDLLERLDPRRTAFFLDVDGTLLGFKDDPLEVVADAYLLGVLQKLALSADGAVALVSGRALSDLDRIMKPLHFAAGAIHGAELRFADGRRLDVAAHALDQVRSAIEDYVASVAGLHVEDKGAAIAVHYRRAPHLGEELSAFMRRIVAHPDLKLQVGKMVFEVKPSAADKGTAIEALMQTDPFSGRCPMFIGDDLTDEQGFEKVNAMGGVSIKVGDPEDKTSAHYRIASHYAAVDLLASCSNS